MSTFDSERTPLRNQSAGLRRPRVPCATRYRERELQDTLSEQAAHAESQTAFFLSGAGTSIGVMFVIVAIVMSLWVCAAALAQAAGTEAPPSLEALAQERAQRRAEQKQPRTTVPFAAAQFDRYAGIYQLDRYQFIALTREGERFFAVPVGQADPKKLELAPESRAKFFVKGQPAQISFAPDARGAVTGMVFHVNGYELPASRVSAAAAKAGVADLAERIKHQTPSPGAEAALRRYIEAFQRGEPNYDEMIPIEKVETYERRAAYAAYFQKWGGLTALTFAEVMPNGRDKFLATYEHGRAEMIVEMIGSDEKNAGIRIGKVEDR